MTVHSTQLGLALTIGTGGTTLYTVPAGKRTIVKSVVLQNLNAAAAQATIAIYNGATELAQWGVHLAAAGAAGDSNADQIWVVLNAGQRLKVFAGAASCSAVASGSELAL